MEYDKKLHFSASAGIGFAANTVLKTSEHAMAACLGIGLTKELIDQRKYGGFSGGDLAFDMLGCTLGVAASEYTGLKVGLSSVSNAPMLTLSFDI